MQETAFYYQNKINKEIYKKILRPILFLKDPEKVHDSFTKFGIFLGKYSLGKKITKKLFYYENPLLEQSILGINFKNPVGLSAGFDKDAKLTEILPLVGFGFIEVGSVTGEVCLGNQKPRLWRLPESKSLAVYYGLKNEGASTIAERLKGKKIASPLGISIAMTNCKENLFFKNAVLDYLKAFKILEPIGDYLTINISCPNALGGQPFLSPHRLE